jgi:uncharacterized protein (UPF0297 family)
MPTVKKAAKEKSYSNAVVTNKVKSYSKDPVFIKKEEEAREAINRIGLPGDTKRSR